MSAPPAPALDSIVLLHGGHYDRDDGVCAMEAVAWLAGEPHSDRPACACPVLTAFIQRVNDRLATDELRIGEDERSAA